MFLKVLEQQIEVIDFAKHDAISKAVLTKARDRIYEKLLKRFDLYSFSAHDPRDREARLGPKLFIVSAPRSVNATAPRIVYRVARQRRIPAILVRRCDANRQA